MNELINNRDQQDEDRDFVSPAILVVGQTNVRVKKLRQQQLIAFKKQERWKMGRQATGNLLYFVFYFSTAIIPGNQSTTTKSTIHNVFDNIDTVLHNCVGNNCANDHFSPTLGK